MDQRGRNKSMKWVIILGAILVVLVLFTIWSDWFGLLGVAEPAGETLPD